MLRRGALNSATLLQHLFCLGLESWGLGSGHTASMFLFGLEVWGLGSVEGAKEGPETGITIV